MSKSLPSEVYFKEALSQRYLAYALSTITSRSLPDVRDGLKPVHRRLIYAMYQLKLNPESSFKKSARIVGDVMGKFHPHGDGAIYDALVRLAQDFSVRYPLVDGQGNFGNIDGDNAAAMRYTEARLTAIAGLLLEGIDKNAIDFKGTYDGESDEQLVLPCSFPNLLANGATGIAVGMATNIPPHNLYELLQAYQHLLDHENINVADLLTFIPGPDFPTGGVIIESKESLLKSYETGKGSIRLRARYHVEPQKGGAYKIVVTEIPYQVIKSKLIEKIADLLIEKKLPLLGDIFDESDDQLRLILEPKTKNIDPKALMESLFRQTDLETRFSMNLNVLDSTQTPRVMNLKEMLEAFKDHRLNVLVRQTTHRLDEILGRLELLKGYLVAYLNLDEVIHIIREEDNPKAVLILKFSLTDFQAEAILNMRLRSLRKLHEIEIKQEQDLLLTEQEACKSLIESPGLQKKELKKQAAKIMKAFSKETPLGMRKTTFDMAPVFEESAFEAEIEKEDVTIICSQKGRIRTVKGHQVDPASVSYKDGDEGQYFITASTADKLLVFASNGKFFTILVDKLPKGRGQGDPLRLYIDIEASEEVLGLYLYNPQKEYLLVSQEGRGFFVKASDVLAQTKNGKQVLSLNEGEKAYGCFEKTSSYLACVGENRKLVIFDAQDIPYLSRGKGVLLQRYKQGNLSDCCFVDLEKGLSWVKKGKNFIEKDLLAWMGKRAAQGRLAPIGFPRNNKFED